jgi:acyl carrier protein
LRIFDAMNNEQINEKLLVIFRQVFKDNNLVINETTTANDVERWDSLTHMTLIATIEDELKIKFKLKDLVNMKNVGDLINIVEQKTSSQ